MSSNNEKKNNNMNTNQKKPGLVNKVKSWFGSKKTNSNMNNNINSNKNNLYLQNSGLNIPKVNNNSNNNNSTLEKKNNNISGFPNSSSQFNTSPVPSSLNNKRTFKFNIFKRLS